MLKRGIQNLVSRREWGEGGWVGGVKQMMVENFENIQDFYK